MSDINQFVYACAKNKVSVVRQMICRGQVDINSRDGGGCPGLCEAMCYNSKDCVAALLSCSNIRLDTKHSGKGQTGLHAACVTNSAECLKLFLAHPACTKHIVTMLDRDGQTGLHAACVMNSVECARLFLAHPACTKQIVTLRDKKGKTAEMIASSRDNQDCVRIIKEFLDNEAMKALMERLRLGDIGGLEPVMLEGMTLTQIGDAIEKITVDEQTMKAGKNTLEVEHKNELDKLQTDYQRKFNSVLDKHAKENNLYKNYCTVQKSQKQRLQAELQQRLHAAQPNPPAQPAKPYHPAQPNSLIPECPICLESMEPPLQIFSCSNGHLICSICRPRLNMDMCHCKKKYMGRATAMEQMVRQILGIM